VLGVDSICGNPPTGQCKLSADTTPSDGQSCKKICAAGGGICFSMHNNSTSCGVLGGDQGCDNESFNSAICFCSHGCGGGPPCASGQTCVGQGQCVPP
jgi:hypothetical protein